MKKQICDLKALNRQTYSQPVFPYDLFAWWCSCQY